jgi:cyclophilin family peptidyl-prolyl cis-trans isomerase
MTGKYLLIGIVLVLGAGFVWGLSQKAAESEKVNVKIGQPTATPVPVADKIEATPAGQSGVLGSKLEENITPMKNFNYASAPEMTINPDKNYTATVKTDKGDMVIELFAKENPVTVNNFVFLSREGFYNNTIFHRIIKDFMIQGGDRTGTGMGSPGYRFDDEKITRDYKRGTFAMANSGPNTNGSQFFIMHADYPLPKSYVIFGSINPSDTASLKTLDAIATVPVAQSSSGEMSKPVSPVNLISVEISEK